MKWNISFFVSGVIWLSITANLSLSTQEEGTSSRLFSIPAGRCPPGWIACPSSNSSSTDCYTAQERCDGTVSCVGGTDELDCPCKSRLKAKYVCDQDGYPDCPNYEDEKGCEALIDGIKCEDDEYMCDSKEDPEAPPICISPSQECDGVQQCNDNSDEKCFRLVENLGNREGPRGWRSKGILQFKRRGVWTVYCVRNIQETLSVQTNVDKLCGEMVGNTGSSDKKNIVTYKFKDECSFVSVECAPPACFGEMTESIDVLDTRIIGGVNAPVGSWPAIVSLYKDGKHDCGGTIISENLVLVAAHCMRQFRIHKYEVRAGLYRRSTFSPTVQYSEVESMIKHPEYKPGPLVNDLAILKLKTPLLLNKWVKEVCLPRSLTNLEVGRDCAIAGWGVVEVTNDTVDELQHAAVPISGHRQCEKVFGAAIPEPDKVVCAGFDEGGIDACSGDSGGPLMCRNCLSGDCKQNQWVQEGIVSFGKGCGIKFTPGVYTRVANYIGWIEEKKENWDDFVSLSSTKHLGSCSKPAKYSIPKESHCDGKVDCLDAEDERGYPDCKINSTPETQNFPTPAFFQSANDLTESETTTESILDTEEDTHDQKLQANGSCLRTHFQCSSFQPPVCINSNLRCDGEMNCADGSDERGCDCVSLLYNLKESLLCDNILDCHDGSDEFCEPCPDPALSHDCKESMICIAENMVCDGSVDCTYGEDEFGCMTLIEDTSSNVAYFDVGEVPIKPKEGIVVVRSENSELYSPICSDSMPSSTLDKICNGLGYINHTEVSYLKSHPRLYYDWEFVTRSAPDYLIVDNNERVMTPLTTEQPPLTTPVAIYLSSTMKNTDDEEILHDSAADIVSDKMLLSQENKTNFVSSDSNVEPISSREAPSMSYTSPLTTFNTVSRVKRQDNDCTQVKITCGEAKCGIVHRVNRNPESFMGLGSVPWTVGLYKNGLYICGGTLIHSQWATVSFDCYVRHGDNGDSSFRVVGGSQRGAIGRFRFKGPFEEEVSVFSASPIKDDLVLLHLSKPLPFTNYINHICMPKTSLSWPGLWKNCMIAGDNEDILSKKVQLKPSRTCPPGRICFEKINENICMNKWSGLIACSESSDSKWQAVGIWQHQPDAACSQPTQHQLLDEETISMLSGAMFEKQLVSEPQCDGFQCPFGRCIDSAKICDGTPDCADLSDEPATCPPPRARCRYPHPLVNCSCPSGMQSCWNGKCIFKTDICDGVSQCSNDEDEQNCPCILSLRRDSPEKICDGNIDCTDQEDEVNCGCDIYTNFRCYKSARANQTSTSNVTSATKEKCLPLSVVCDSKKDCPNNEDEENCFNIHPLAGNENEPVDTSALLVEFDALGKPVPHPKGLFLIRFEGRWFTYDYADWLNSFVNLSETTCKTLGYLNKDKGPLTSSRIISPFVSSGATDSRSVAGMHRAASSELAAKSEGQLLAVHIDCGKT